MKLLSAISNRVTGPAFLAAASVIQIPRCTGRYMPPGTLFRPYNERFDENCDPKPPLHPETSRFKEFPLPGINPKGRIANKRPLRMICEPNKVYWWCSCGQSNGQPFCDGQHIKLLGSNPQFHIKRIPYKPIRMVFKERTEVWWCTCKQTGEPPFCDGSHNCEEVQAAIRY